MNNCAPARVEAVSFRFIFLPLLIVAALGTYLGLEVGTRYGIGIIGFYLLVISTLLAFGRPAPELNIFSTAYVVRASWAVFYFLRLSDKLPFSDAVDYLRHGQQIALSWSVGRPVNIVALTGSTQNGYTVYNAIFQLLFGSEHLSPILGNVLVGALTALITVSLVRELGYPREAIRVGWLFALMPGLVFWSGVNLKDTLFCFLMTTLPLAYLRFRNSLQFRYLTFFFIAVAFAATIRAYAALLFIAACAADFVINRTGHVRRHAALIAITVALAVLIVLQHPILGGLIRQLASGGISPQLLFLLSDGAFQSFGPELLLSIPAGIARFIATPVPWKAEDLYRALIPDSIIWIPMIPLVFLGAAGFFRRHFRIHLWMFAFLVMTIGLYSISLEVQGPRHRLQIMPLLLFLGVTGITDTLRDIGTSRHRAWARVLAIVLLEAGMLGGLMRFG